MDGGHESEPMSPNFTDCIRSRQTTKQDTHSQPKFAVKSSKDCQMGTTNATPDPGTLQRRPLTTSHLTSYMLYPSHYTLYMQVHGE